MSLILNIETATSVCSVALSDKEKIVASRELDEGFTHAENLHLFIRDIFKEADTELNSVSAIAVSKGPGSYTGLRIGVSTAKGLAYALQKPLIAVETLQLMSAGALQKKKGTFYCPMIDARRMEVYTAVFDSNLQRINDTKALIVDEGSVRQFDVFEQIDFFGDGMQKCRELLSGLKNASFVDEIKPSALYMASLVHHKFTNCEFEDLAYFEPFYLKEFLAGKKIQNLE